MRHLADSSPLPGRREIVELAPHFTLEEAETTLRLICSAYIPNPPDIVEWAERNFYVVETKQPIRLQPVQQAVLREFFRRGDDGRFVYRTGLYSTIKKSGKTTIAALIMRWAAETWGDYGEIFHMGNKLEQAKERAFKICKRSIELNKGYEGWDLQATAMKYQPNGTVIKALPVNAAGEAGGNQCLTTWTEFHGYVSGEAEKMYSELQPVPTQALSFRAVESYAGYDGESNLLKHQLWDRAKPPEDPERYRIHDEYPIYAIPEEGLIAYIDTGHKARRMPWQTPEYYIKAEAEELPHEFKRIHLNEWVTSRTALINVGLWDRLEGDITLDNPAKTDVILAADASVSGDCTALAVIAYTPPDADGNDMVKVLKVYIWEPEDGEKIDYEVTLKPAMEAAFNTYRVVGVAYDPYQLHYFMDQMSKDDRYRSYAPDEESREQFWYAFPQTAERVKADTDLLTRIRDARLVHDGDKRVRMHVQNADAKRSGEKAIRVVKRTPKAHVDALVGISMGAWRAYTLFMNAPEPVDYVMGVARF